MRAFPVPLALVGNNSGVIPETDAYMMLLVNPYAQFQPKSALEERAVVPIRTNIPVETILCVDQCPWKLRETIYL